MRLEMPRFLTQGDTVTISGVVHNFLEERQIDKDFARLKRRAVARFGQ